MTDVANNLEAVHERIEAAARESGRTADDITLVSVSKTVAAERVRLAYDAGERDFGENRVQEYLEKQQKLPSDARWHIIGRLQTNKVKYIINNVYLLHSVDRLGLASEIERELEKKGGTMDVLLQVNTAREESKAGFMPEEIQQAAESIAGMQRLHVRGIMMVAPFTGDTEYLSGIFRQTKAIYDETASKGYGNFDFRWLSMGMSGDFEPAIKAGANMIRVGSAIFGERYYG